ncbi:hypothetical protein GO013_12490 [Pseudodesulfovibrio sp. JC047]|uniref:hypothetical protein n=1 Tax=Pseudodesulfovibrio sp. JC047 TaxID=2683199 RepID=UPI0013D486A3|nr:hypothetical protein [Pseudodesulfovibrio sp. JC047]NDV20229.1 hypothetical protein [Pseudodesulfovibrio sp. JC047]
MVHTFWTTMDKIFKPNHGPAKRPSLSLAGVPMLKVRLVGYTSQLVRVLVEDLVLEAAAHVQLDVIFVDHFGCNLCVVCDDGLASFRWMPSLHQLRRLNIPVIFFGFGTDRPVQHLNAMSRMALFELLARASAVSVRTQSVGEYIKPYVRVPIEIVGDPLVQLARSDKCQGNAIRKGVLGRKVGIALVGRRNFGLAPTALLDLLAAYGDKELKAAPDTELHLFAFKIKRRGPVGRLFEREDEEHLARILRDRLCDPDRVVIHPFCEDVFLRYARLDEMDFLLSLRSSAGVAAMLEGRPAVVMEKRDDRGEEIFRELGLEGLLVSPRNLDYTDYIDLVDSKEHKATRFLVGLTEKVEDRCERQRLFFPLRWHQSLCSLTPYIKSSQTVLRGYDVLSSALLSVRYRLNRKGDVVHEKK